MVKIQQTGVNVNGGKCKWGVNVKMENGKLKMENEFLPSQVGGGD